MQFVSFAVLGKRIKSIKALLKDPNVPKRKKLLVIFGIIYLIMPIDLIPAPVLIFGLADDLVLWLFILTHLSDELDKYWKEKDESFSPERDLKDKVIIESTAQEREAEEEEEQAGYTSKFFSSRRISK